MSVTKVVARWVLLVQMKGAYGVLATFHVKYFSFPCVTLFICLYRLLHSMHMRT